MRVEIDAPDLGQKFPKTAIVHSLENVIMLFKIEKQNPTESHHANSWKINRQLWIASLHVNLEFKL